jgi:mannosyltransferase OCH1-like enzyme
MIAPADKTRWHPIWEPCYASWLQHYADHEIVLWNDSTDIDNFVQTYYPQYYELYSSFPAHIMRIDFVRFALLHHYGGIYADMDMFCYRNFHDELTAELSIIEAPYGDEFLESSLMVSQPHHEFWIDCMNLSHEVFYGLVKKHNITIPFNHDLATQYLLTAACGPNLICRVWRKWARTQPARIQALSGILYNNHGMSYHSEYRTKHLMTGMWGKEAIDFIEKNNTNTALPQTLENAYLTEMKRYANMGGVNSLKDFDFYTDYTQGGMKKEFTIDLDRSDIDDPSFNSNVTFNYG